MCKDEEEKDMPKTIEKFSTPKERLEQSLKELKMIKQGQISEPTWEDLKNELEEGDDD